MAPQTNQTNPQDQVASQSKPYDYNLIQNLLQIHSISFVTRIFLDKLRTAKQIQKKILHRHVQTVNQPHVYLM